MGRPKKRPHEIETAKRHIMRAAARVFARQGFTAAAMQDIAAEAGYSAPSLYKYFKGKQAILDELMASLKVEFEALYTVSFPTGLTFPQKLEMLLMAQGRWVEEQRETFIFLTRREGMAITSSEESEVPPAVVQFERWFEENAGPDDLHGTSREIAAWLVWGICHAFFIRWLVKEPNRSLSSQMGGLVDLVMNGLTASAE